MKKFLPIILILLTALSGCSLGSHSYSGDFFAMDTYMTVSVNGSNPEQSVKNARALIKKLDKKLSTHDKDSEIYKLNKNGSKKLSDDSVSLLKEALRFNKLTSGAFNPAMLNVTQLWGFSDKNYRVPDKDEITLALKSAKPERISIKNNEVTLGLKGMKIDLGGIAKGYASEKVIEELKKDGVKSAIINLGGNVQTLGAKPDGSLWTVAIENPDKGSDYLGQLKVKDKAVITSGGYERNFKRNGKVYHHILNPENGYPAESGLQSVTIISENGVLSDALSTSLFVMGEKKAVEFYKNSKEKFDFILYTDDGKLKISEGIKDNFHSDFKYEVIQ